MDGGERIALVAGAGTFAPRRLFGAYIRSLLNDEIKRSGRERLELVRGDVIGLNYTDTDGKTKYCYNSAIASCRIRLSGPDSRELTATRRAMFEILTDTRHADVPLLA